MGGAYRSEFSAVPRRGEGACATSRRSSSPGFSYRDVRTGVVAGSRCHDLTRFGSGAVVRLEPGQHHGRLPARAGSCGLPSDVRWSIGRVRRRSLFASASFGEWSDASCRTHPRCRLGGDVGTSNDWIRRLRIAVIDDARPVHRSCNVGSAIGRTASVGNSRFPEFASQHDGRFHRGGECRDPGNARRTFGLRRFHGVARCIVALVWQHSCRTWRRIGCASIA